MVARGISSSSLASNVAMGNSMHLALLAAFALASDLPDDSASGIVNGNEAADLDFDQVVGLGIMDPMTGEPAVFCSGTLIQKEWIVTAAHCIEGSRSYAGMELYAFWGPDVAGSGARIAIPWADSFEYDGYNPSAFTDDIGLVKLASPKLGTKLMVLGDAPPDETWVGTPLTFVGYGITSDGLSDSGTKRWTEIPLESWDDSNLLSFDADTNVCQGDSGGATLRETPEGFELVGINAFVTPGCRGGSNGSTRVDPHVEWILEHVPHALTEHPERSRTNGGDAAYAGVDDEFGVGLDGMGAPTGTWESDGGCDSTGGGLPGAGLSAAGLLALALRRRAGAAARR